MKLNTIDLAELEELIAKSEVVAAKAVRRAIKKVVFDVTDAAVAGNVQMVAAGPADSPTEPHAVPPFGALQNVYKYWSEVVLELLAPLITNAWNHGVNATVKSVHSVTPEWDAPVVNYLALDRLEAATQHMGNLATEIWQHAQAELIAGVESGDSIQQMAQRVSAAADLSIPRAQTIVRTEVIASANAGTFDLIEAAGFTGKQEWLATNDPKTRLTHKQADGQKVEIGATFDVGMWQAHYPGDKTLPPGERYNCRCTVAYDVEEDDLVAALTAAGKWDAGKHPRDSKGRFVKKNLVSILKHDATDAEINEAIDNLTIGEWLDLTPEQQKIIEQEVSLSGGFLAKNAIDTFKSLTPTTPTTSSSSNVGPPLKVTHKDIHSPKKSGDILAVSKDGKTSIVWNETQKKYAIMSPGGNTVLMPKSKVYDFMQGHEWNSPVVKNPIDDEPVTPAISKPMGWKKGAGKKVAKKVASKFAPPVKIAAKPATPVAESLGKELDFEGFTKVGGQGGSNPGGAFVADDGVEKWYIKKAKTPKHASNEVAASALYNAAGIETPQVEKGSGASGIGGGLQTGTKIVPGAKSDLKQKLKDPAFKKEIQKGFAIDAWLANWDVAGLSYDNIVTGADGKPHRIDVGGAILYRAQGTPKGSAFGDTVPELDTLRSASSNPQSAAIFGDMTDADIKESAQRLKNITGPQIDKIVKDAGLPPSVADTLRKRRLYILDKYGLLDYDTPGKPETKSTSTPAMSSKEWGDYFKSNEYEGDEILATNDDGFVIATAPNGDDLVMYDKDFNEIATESPSDWASLMTASNDIFSWKKDTSGSFVPKKPKADLDGPGPDPGDLNWATMGEDVDLGTYPPGSVIAYNGDGDYLEVLSTGEVGLYDADGQIKDAVPASEMESLTLSTSGWKEGDNGAGDEMDFSPGATVDVNTPTATNVPDSDAPPGTIQLWNNEAGFTAFVTQDGGVYSKGPSGNVVKTDTEPAMLDLLGYTKTWDTSSTLPDTDISDADEPDIPEYVDGVKVPKVTAEGKPVVAVWQSTKNSFLVEDNDGGLHIIDNNSGSTISTVWGQSVLTTYNYKKVSASEGSTPPPPSTSLPGAQLPYQVKFKAKTWMKDSNLGYWSKPEKIWSVLDSLQTAYPDPDNPGHSKYTKLQLLQALDSQLKTTKPNPYEEKIKKWLNTPAGKQATSGATVTPTPSLMPTAPSPVKKGAKTAVKKTAVPKKGFDPDAIEALGLDGPGVDAITPAKKTQIFDTFKGQNMYLSSPDANVFDNMKALATGHKLSVLQVAKIIDEKSAQKAGVANGELFEKKLIKWAKTPAGTAKITGKAPPTPPGPELKFKGTIPTKPASDHMKYDIINHTKAAKLQAEAEAKWGAVTTKEKAGLRHFTGGNYTAINMYLRGQTTSISDNDLKHSLNAQQGFRPSTEPMRLDRAVGWDALGFGYGGPTKAQLEAMVGKKGTHKGFSSTSIDGYPAFGGPLVLIIEAPPGTPMAYVAPYSKNSGEREMLLAAGLDFEILGIEEYKGSSGKTKVRVRIIP